VKIDRKRDASNIGWLFLLPGILVFFIFFWYPTGAAFVVSMQKYEIFGNSKFIGLVNFRNALSDPLTLISFRNTFYFTFLSILLTFLVPILVAILLMEMRKNVVRIMMILWFIPISSMAGVVLWKWFYDPQYGLLNGILISLGLPKLGWLQDSRITMLCLVLPGLIMYGPGLIYIASLQSLPSELYEAAELEGASFWRKMWSITLPRMRPVISVMLTLAIISNMQMFTQAYVMTYGGPGNATYSVVMHIYEIAFTEYQFGKSTCIAIMLFFIIMCLVILQRKFFKENLDV